VAEVVPGYSVVKRLGIGARSQVFQVVQSSTGQTFALKKVVREDHEDDRFLVQAITEFEIAKPLNHPSLRKMYELYRIRRLFRLREVQVIMEYVDGISLDNKRPERIDQTVEVFLKVAEGLKAMHDMGYLHTDIKPNNILLTAGGEVKIIDFGQSCPMGTRKPRIQGTPDYIAPEQVERHPLNAQTDIFNFGATMYWALTGKAYPTVISKQGGPQEYALQPKMIVPSPHDLRPEVPAGLSRLVMEACSYERNHRPRTMKEIISRLDLVLTGRRKAEPAAEPESAGQAPPPPVTPEPGNKRGLEDSDDALDFSAIREVVKDVAGRPKRKREDEA